MVRKEFTYTDYDGREKSLEAYFQLNKNDCIDLNNEFKEEGGLVEYLKTLMKEAKERPDDVPDEAFIRFVRLLVTKAFGIRPKDDPSLYLKDDDRGRPLVRKFKGCPAYDEFVFALLTGKENLGDFVDGIMPNVDEAQKTEAKKLLAAEGIVLPETEPVPAKD